MSLQSNKRSIKSQSTINSWKDTLMTSLRLELNDMNILIGEMERFFDCSSLMSWLFPSKTCKDIINTKPDLDDYTNILEYILDRTYVIFNIFLDKVEKLTTSWNKNVQKPKKLSFAAIARATFDKLEEIEDTKSDLEKSRKDNSKYEEATLNSCTQTEETESTSSCSSCDYSVKCIKAIANPLEATLEASNIKLAKDGLKDKIFHITQYGCTKLICDAAVEDINNLVSAKDHYKEKFIELNEIHKSTIAEFDLFKRRFIDVKDNYKLQSGHWHKERNILQGNVQILEGNVEELKEQLHVAQKNFQVANSKFFEEVTKHNVSMLKIENVKRKNCILHDDNCKLSDTINITIAELLKILDLLNIKYVNLSDKLDNLLGRISRIKVDGLLSILSKFGHMKDTIAIQLNELQKYKPPFTDSAMELSSVRGDPLQDMVNQIKLNKLHMRRLNDENDALMKTVNRLRELDAK